MSMERILEEIIRAVGAREDELVAAMVEENVEQVTDLGLAADEPELVDTVRESARGNLRAALSSLARDRRPPQTPPAGALDEARAAARSGVPLEALLRTYRVGQAVVLDATIHEVEDLGLDRSTREEVVRLLTRFSFAYVQNVAQQVEYEYLGERRRLARASDHNQRRLELVLSILNGLSVSRHELGYDLDNAHLGLIVSGAVSNEFAQLWDAQHVARLQPRFELLQHPRTGALPLECGVLQSRAPGQRLILFRAAPGTPAGGRLATLARLAGADSSAADS